MKKLLLTITAFSMLTTNLAFADTYWGNPNEPNSFTSPESFTNTNEIIYESQETYTQEESLPTTSTSQLEDTEETETKYVDYLILKDDGHYYFNTEGLEDDSIEHLWNSRIAFYSTYRDDFKEIPESVLIENKDVLLESAKYYYSEARNLKHQELYESELKAFNKCNDLKVSMYYELSNYLNDKPISLLIEEDNDIMAFFNRKKDYIDLLDDSEDNKYGFLKPYGDLTEYNSYVINERILMMEGIKRKVKVKTSNSDLDVADESKVYLGLKINNISKDTNTIVFENKEPFNINLKGYKIITDDMTYVIDKDYVLESGKFVTVAEPSNHRKVDLEIKLDIQNADTLKVMKSGITVDKMDVR